MHQTKIEILNSGLLALKTLSLAFSVSSVAINTRQSPTASYLKLDKTDSNKFSTKSREKENVIGLFGKIIL